MPSKIRRAAAGGIEVDSTRPGRIALLRADPVYQRKVLIWGAATAVGAVTLISAVLCILAFALAPDLPDGIALAGDVLGGAVVLLAVIAATVAIMAYAVSTGTPDLRLGLSLSFNL